MVYSDYTKQHIFYNSRGVKPSCIARLLKKEGMYVTRVGVWKFLKRFERYWTISSVPGSLYSNVRDTNTWNQSEPNRSKPNRSAPNRSAPNRSTQYHTGPKRTVPYWTEAHRTSERGANMDGTYSELQQYRTELTLTFYWYLLYKCAIINMLLLAQMAWTSMTKSKWVVF